MNWVTRTRKLTLTKPRKRACPCQAAPDHTKSNQPLPNKVIYKGVDAYTNNLKSLGLTRGQEEDENI